MIKKNLVWHNYFLKNMSKKIQQNMIPISTILITIVLRIILIFVLKVQLNFYKEKLILKKIFRDL